MVMKKIYYKTWIFMLMLLVISCGKEDYITENPITKPGGNTFTFNIFIPGEQIISTRGEAIESGLIDNLYILVFDQNGTFLTRAQATPTADPGKYKTLLSFTDPDTPQDKKKRIIHFVCNYNWSGFSDVHAIGKHENEIIGSLSVSGGKIAYWQRLELPDGIDANTFSDTIELLRNRAKISVINNSSLALANTRFALGDFYDYGTIAPFNTSTLTFEEGSVCESPQGALQTALDSDFVETGENGSYGQSILCYERNNSTSKTPMYIIVKGKYAADQEDTYYKIDIINDGEEELYDITRNYHYIIDIQEVVTSGHQTLQEAINSPASNNLLYSVLLEDYAAISDGRAALRVETTTKTLVESDKEFTISFSYIPDITTGIEDNSLVTIELQQDPTLPVVVSSSQILTTTDNAYYTAKTVSSLPEYGTYTARLVFIAKHDNITLRRTVSLRFRQPSVFEAVSTNPARIPAAAEEEVDLHLTIPSNIRSALFPIEIFITTLSLTPNLAYNGQDKLTLDYSKPGVYRYKYIVRDSGDYTLHFRTTGTATNEILKIESELFNTSEVPLKN